MGSKLPLEPREPLLELGLRLAQRRPGRLDPQARGHDLVVERRHDDLDAVVGHDLEPVEEVLLGRQPRRRGTRGRRRAQPVDELVDAGRAERRRRGARDQLPPCDPHAANAPA